MPHQSLRDVPSGGQRFEVSTVVDELHLLQVQSLQNLLAGPVHHLQLLVAVHQDQGATVDPLRGQEFNQSQTLLRHTAPKRPQAGTISLQLCAYAQTDDVTAQVKLSLFNDMDGPILLLLYLDVFTGTSQVQTKATSKHFLCKLKKMKAAECQSNTSEFITRGDVGINL